MVKEKIENGQGKGKNIGGCGVWYGIPYWCDITEMFCFLLISFASVISHYKDCV